MPYPHAHIFVLALIPATLLGFWPFYFSELGSAPAVFHLHGVSATAWLVLLAFQSWSVHNGHASRHRQMGLISLALFPIFFAGFFLVFQTESQKTLMGDPFRVVYGPGIGAITLLAIATMAYLYFSGLKNRRNTQLHARYLLAIPFLFFESVFGRILNNFVPGMIVDDVSDIRLVYLGFHLSQFVAIALAMCLYAQAPRFGRPFLAVSGSMVLQSIALEAFDGIQWWRQFFISLAQIPVSVTLFVGISLGLLVSWLGWLAPLQHYGRSQSSPQ